MTPTFPRIGAACSETETFRASRRRLKEHFTFAYDAVDNRRHRLSGRSVLEMLEGRVVLAAFTSNSDDHR